MKALTPYALKNGFSERTISRAREITTTQTVKMNEHQE
jgi:hypothetical protein